ncbi:MAG: dTMP kinase [Planctomycetota bacterium]
MPAPTQPRVSKGDHRDELDALATGLEGVFLVFEGPDGSGKTTQLNRLKAELQARGLVTTQVRDPGGTHAGERIREVLLDTETGEIAVACETLLYMASRAQLCAEVIRPAIDARHLVFADRFVSSTIAYQGGGGGMPEADIVEIARIATAGAVPDLVIVFDVDGDTAAKRLNPLLDRMEAKGAEFHGRVRESYLRQVRAEPARHLLVDATGGPEDVFASLVRGLLARVPLGGVRP